VRDSRCSGDTWQPVSPAGGPSGTPRWSLLGAIAGASLAVRRGTASAWSEVSVIVLMAPAALAGGLLRRRQRR